MSRLSLLRRHWERFARTDPYWAILTDPTRRHGRWREDEFFATGHAMVQAHLARLEREGFVVTRQRALDFGCGVGRLTRALGETFADVTGVDVSEEMLALARRHHADRAHLRFVHNPRTDLRQFADASYDFVYSLITLQHLPDDLAAGYLGEFMRVARPDGLVVVQIVTQKRRVVSLWPPTLLKLGWRAVNRRLIFVPVMDMCPLPVARAQAAIAAAGGEILAWWPDTSGGGRFESRILVARARPAA